MTFFKIIDKNNKISNKITEIRINNYKYNILKKRIPILLDLELPYEGCFYLTIKITLLNKLVCNDVLITVYLNQTNYYYISLAPVHFNNIELIFYKAVPNKLFESHNYEDITYEENFERNEQFKRLCLININRKELNLIKKKEKYEEILELNSFQKYKNLTMIFSENLKILSFYPKDISSSIKSSIYDLHDNIKIFESLNSKLSIKDIQFIKNKLNNNYFNIRNNKFRFKKRLSYFIDQNISLIEPYGKYNIFEGCFIKTENELTIIDYNENNFQKFINMMNQMELFHGKCGAFIKNKITIEKLYLTACYA